VSKAADQAVADVQEAAAEAAAETIPTDHGAATAQQPGVIEQTVISDPSWGPKEPAPDEVFELGMLQLAEFQGAGGSEVPHSIAQPHLNRFEEALKTEGVTSHNRKSEGFYGPKTRELVAAAYEKLLGVPDHPGVVGPDLIAELHRRGLPAR
jgi:hypothetical protein